jgi:hypothetical protein
MSLNIFEGFGHVMEEVALALLPLLVFFLIFQLFFLRLPMRKILDVVKGMVLTFLGLSIFLQGVNVGFMPAGQEIGAILGGASYNWVLIPIGFAIGFLAIFAEPAVRVLTDQIERVSSGYIPGNVMLYTLSIGVAVSVALAMCRILYGISLWWILIPGYALAFFMSRFTSKTFTMVAFDSGGVATGPMTATFILAMAVGVANALEGRDPLIEGFGLVSLVALAPILSVLTLGVLYNREEKKNERVQTESASESVDA